jgi:hypothetical protein
MKWQMQLLTLLLAALLVLMVLGLLAYCVLANI